MKSGSRRSLFVALAVLAIVGAVWVHVFLATTPQQTLDQRVHDVASQLRCPVCQGESVADSPSLISQQMRAVIRRQLQSGTSEQQVIQYFEARYGPQIVEAPPWQGFTLLAWLVPIALLAGGALLLLLVLRDWRRSAGVPIPEERVVQVNNEELGPWRALLEEELAAEDALFRREVS